ncbi:MAG: RDD family protein [Ferrimicrobium sp.]
MTERTNLEIASLSRRFGALMVDTLVVFFGSVVLELIVGGFVGMSTPSTSVIGLSMGSGVYIINMIAIAGYYTYLLGSKGGQTLGAIALRVRVVGLDGSPLGYRQSAIRFAVSIVSTGVVFLGYIIAIATPSHRTLHDLVARSQVIRAGSTG